jgi:hypothetical protein
VVTVYKANPPTPGVNKLNKIYKNEKSIYLITNNKLNSLAS